jgi:hypothetical protein
MFASLHELLSWQLHHLPLAICSLEQQAKYRILQLCKEFPIFKLRFQSFKSLMGSQLSPLSIVSDYWLDDWAIKVWSLAEARDFSCSLCFHTSPGAHQASCPVATRGLFPGIMRSRGVMLITHPHLVSRSWMSRSYTSSPPKRLYGR